MITKQGDRVLPNLHGSLYLILLRFIEMKLIELNFDKLMDLSINTGDMLLLFSYQINVHYIKGTLLTVVQSKLQFCESVLCVALSHFIRYSCHTVPAFNKKESKIQNGIFICTQHRFNWSVSTSL